MFSKGLLVVQEVQEIVSCEVNETGNHPILDFPSQLIQFGLSKLFAPHESGVQSYHVKVSLPDGSVTCLGKRRLK